MKSRTIGVGAALALVAGLVSAGSAPALAEETDACATFLAQEVNVSTQLIEATCDVWAENAPSSSRGAMAAPTIAFAWTDIGVFSPDATVASAGWPISATCLITGVITGPTTAYYVLSGVANTAGPAVSTTIQCSASPAALYVNQTAPGPVSVGADFTTTIPGSALTGQKICSFAQSTYLVRPLTMRTGTIPCSPV